MRRIRCQTLVYPVAVRRQTLVLTIQLASRSHGFTCPRSLRCDAVEAKPNPGTNGYSFRDALCLGSYGRSLGRILMIRVNVIQSVPLYNVCRKESQRAYAGKMDIL